MVLAAIHVGLAAFFLSERSPETPAALTGLPLDDAWIHLVYGRAVATCGLPCYNEGELEAGFTSPTWVLVCAAAHGLARWPALDVVLALKILGVASAIAMTLGVYELTRTLTGGGLGGLLAGVLTALTPALAFSQVAGMEVCLAAALGLWAMYAWHREKYLAVGVLLAAAFLTRPEMVLLYVLLLGWALVSWRRELFGKKRAALLKLALPVVVAGAAWSGYCLAATGLPLPNTFYAKLDHGQPEGLGTVFVEIVWALPANFAAAGLILYVLGAIRLLRSSGPARRLVLLFPWCFFIAVALTRNMPPDTGRYYYWLRYAAPAIPFLYIPIGVGWRFLWGPARPAASARPGSVFVTQTPAVFLAVLTLLAHPQALLEQRWRYAWDCQKMNHMQVVLGRWVAEQAPPGRDGPGERRRRDSLFRRSVYYRSDRAQLPSAGARQTRAGTDHFLAVGDAGIYEGTRGGVPDRVPGVVSRGGRATGGGRAVSRRVRRLRRALRRRAGGLVDDDGVYAALILPHARAVPYSARCRRGRGLEPSQTILNRLALL